ncbi:MAG: hypothetical protein Hals2KO_21630 [Halioglobus sp.]
MGKPIVRFESGQTPQPFEEMTDSGDNTTFSASFSPISKASNSGFVLALYGLLTGGAITPGSSNDEVDVAALTVLAPGMTGANSEGVVSISAASGITVSRGAASDTHRITSITVSAAGAVVPVPGVDGTAFSDVRGADGGPPYIPVGSIEIGQVKVDSITAALVASTEIFAVPGSSREMASFPVPNLIDYATGEVTYSTAIPAIHTGDVPRKVFIKGSTPIFSDIGYSTDWSPAKQSFSNSSTDTYDGAVASVSSSLSTATFTALLEDGVSDHIVSLEGQDLWVEYRPDRDQSLPKQLTQGPLSSSWTRPAGANRVQASFVIAASTATVNVTS